MLTALLTLIAAVALVIAGAYAIAAAGSLAHRRLRLLRSGECSTPGCIHPREWLSFCGLCRSRISKTDRDRVTEAVVIAQAVERSMHDLLAATYDTDIERLTRTTADV